MSTPTKTARERRLYVQKYKEDPVKIEATHGRFRLADGPLTIAETGQVIEGIWVEGTKVTIDFAKHYTDDVLAFVLSQTTEMPDAAKPLIMLQRTIDEFDKRAVRRHGYSYSPEEQQVAAPYATSKPDITVRAFDGAIPDELDTAELRKTTVLLAAELGPTLAKAIHENTVNWVTAKQFYAENHPVISLPPTGWIPQERRTLGHQMEPASLVELTAIHEDTQAKVAFVAINELGATTGHFMPSLGELIKDVVKPDIVVIGGKIQPSTKIWLEMAGFEHTGDAYVKEYKENRLS